MRALKMMVLGLMVLMVAPWASQAAWMPYPGLPEPVIEPGQWYWVQQVGMSETAKAKQFVKVPPITLASFGALTSRADEPPPPGAKHHYRVGGAAAFVSPPGAPEPYGYMAPMRVRTVGFGLLPAEAIIEISQRRTPDGKVVPILAELTQTNYPDVYIFDPTIVEDAFNVRVTQVLIDGVDIELVGDCRTVRPAPVKMIGPGYTTPSDADIYEYLQTLDEKDYFNPMVGGQLSGTIDIPPFTDCITRSGDDLSPMLTLSASGPGNTVIAKARSCVQASTGTHPPGPGDWNNFPFPDPGQVGIGSGCKPFEPDEMIPYPERDSD